MTDDRLITGRPMLTIDEAIQMGKCNVADLFYKAEIGELTIYVIADGWKVGRIYEIDHSIKLDINKPRAYFRSPDLSKLPQPDSAEFDAVSDALFRQQSQLESNQDFIVGNKILYGSLNGFRKVFDYIADQQPIAAKTFKEYRISPEKAEITLDLNRILELKIPDKVHERFICPEPAVLVQDALLNGKLVVMAAELRPLIGQSLDETLSELYEHEFWPEELGIAIAAWQNARKNYKPGDKPSALIRDWLNSNPSTKDMSDAAVARIVTVANWVKIPGPAKNMDKDG